MVAQEQYDIVLDRVGNKFRYSRITALKDDDNLLDTLEIRYFPAKALDSSQFRGFLIAEIQSHNERARELRRVLNETNKAREGFIMDFNTVFGAGAWDTVLVGNTRQALQGNWLLIEKGGPTRDLVVDGFSANTPNKEGTIVVQPDFTASLRGIYAFNLTFNQLASGNWKAIRTANGVTREFFLRRPY